MAFYNVEKSQSIYYDENHLMIKLLFETLERSRQFYEQLRSISYRFSLVMPVEVLCSPHPMTSLILYYQINMKRQNTILLIILYALMIMPLKVLADPMKRHCQFVLLVILILCFK